MPTCTGSISEGRALRTTRARRDNGIVSVGLAQCGRLGMAGQVKGDTYRTFHRIASRLVYVDQECLA
jgi:hypothetical protein